MIDPDVLMRLLVVALERLPDHRIVLDQATWDAMRAKHLGRGGGVLLQQLHGGAIEVRMADHEDRLVMADRVRKAGGLLVDTPDFMFGVQPDTDE